MRLLSRCEGRRAAEGPRPGPILPSRNAAWRATPSFFAVRSDSSSGAMRAQQRPPLDEQIDHGQPDAFVLVPEVLLEDRQHDVVGQLESRQRFHRGRPDLRGRVMRTLEDGLMDPVVRRGQISQALDRPRADDGILVRGGGDQRLDRGRCRSARARARLPAGSVRSCRRARGSGRGRPAAASGPIRPRPMTTSARTLSFRSFSRPRRPSTAGLPMAASARADR